jgi:glycosyltransferase involved in cell wall biosynthesis
MTRAAGTAPLVSVVIETVTARYDLQPGASLADDLEATLSAVLSQTYPQERIETVVVVDSEVQRSATDELRRRFPFVKVTASDTSNYFAGKNAGTAAADGSVIAMLDGDCVADEAWLERLVSRFEPGVGAVAGRTRYGGDSIKIRTLSVPDFGYVVGTGSGGATGLLLNNVAFRAEVLREHPLDERIRRNGGCAVLFHELRADGQRVLYEPGAMVAHAPDDIRGRDFLRKHFGRGYDIVAMYRLDDRGLLRGTAPFRRFGAAALVAITGHRVLHDWAHMLRYRKQIGIAPAALPWFAVVAVVMRLAELAGMIAALVDPGRYAARPNAQG